MLFPERMPPATGDVRRDAEAMARYIAYMIERLEMAFSNLQKENRQLREENAALRAQLEQLQNGG